MAITYRRTNTDSDLGGSIDFNKAILDAALDTTGQQQINLAASETRNSFAFTDVGVPGTNGATGDYTIEVEVLTGESNVQLSCAVARVNSSGVQQAISAFSAEQTADAGVHTFSFTNLNLGTWSTGDRLRVTYRYRNTHSHTGRTYEVNHGGVNNQVVTPFTAPPGIEIDPNDMSVASVISQPTVPAEYPPPPGVEFDALGSHGAASASQTQADSGIITWSHTIGDVLGRILLVGVTFGQQTDLTSVVPAVDYGGTPLTLHASTLTGSGTSGKAALFYLLDPPVGTDTVTVDFTGVAANPDVQCGSVSYANVDQNDPIDVAVTNVSTTDSIAATVASENDGMVVDVVACGGPIDTIPAVNDWYRTQNTSTGGGNGAMGHTDGTGGNVTRTYERAATEWWGILAAELNYAVGVITLNPDDLFVSVDITSPTIVQQHFVTPDSLSVGIEASSPTTTITYSIQPNDLDVNVSVASPEVTVFQAVNPNDLDVDVSVTTPTLVQTHVINPSSLSVDVSISKPSVGVLYSVQPNDLLINSVVTSPTLTQLHNILPSDMVVDPTISQTTVTIPPIGQLLPPVADLHVGNWLNQDEASVDLFESVNEADASSVDYIYTPDDEQPTPVVFRISSADVPDTRTNHKIQFQGWKSGPNAVTYVPEWRTQYVSEVSLGNLIHAGDPIAMTALETTYTVDIPDAAAELIAEQQYGVGVVIRMVPSKV